MSTLNSRKVKRQPLEQAMVALMQDVTATADQVDIQLQRELASLNMLSWALSQSLDLDQVLTMALETSLRVVGGLAGGVYLLEGEPGEFRLRAHITLAAAQVEYVPSIRYDHPFARHAIDSGGPQQVDWCQLVSGPGQAAGEVEAEAPTGQPICVCVPLAARNRVQGLMAVLTEEMTPDQALMLRVMGQHIGVAIDNAQLYRRAQQDARRLRHEAERWNALNRAALAVTGTRSEQAVYDTITRTLCELGLSAVICAVEANAAPESEADDFVVVSVATPAPRLIAALERLMGRPLVGFRFPVSRASPYYQTLRNNQTEVVVPVVGGALGPLPEIFSRLTPGLIRRLGLSCVISAPLRVNEQLSAVLAVGSGDLTVEDVPAITSFARHASAAVENARLLETERRQRQEADMLRDLVVTVNSTLDLDQVLELAVRRLQILHQATACSVSFLEEDGQTFVFKATTDPALDVTQRITFSAAHSIAGQAIRERRVQIANDVRPAEQLGSLSQPTGALASTRSLLTAPLFAGDRPLGVIQVLSASPNAFSAADAQLLATTAALLETAVARARAYAQAIQLVNSERRQREVAETLRQVAGLINASLDLDTVLNRILEQLSQVVDFDSASLMLVTGDQLTMRAIHGFSDPESVLAIRSAIKDNLLFQEMLASRRPIVIADVRKDPRYRVWAGAETIRSWIGVPLLVRDQVIGQLAVDRRRSEVPYEAQDAELVFAFAQQAANAIANAQLFEAEHHQRQMAEALREVAATINASLDRDAVLSRIMEQLRRVVRFDSACALLVDGDELVFSSGLGFDDLESLIGQRLPLGGDDPLARVFKQRTPLLIADVQNDPSWAGWPAADRVRGWLGVPLIVGERVIGVLAIDSFQPDAYSDKDVQLARAFADHAANAIQNAWLYQAAEEARQFSDSLREIGASLVSTLDLDEVLDRVLDSLGKVVPFDSASVLLADADGALHTKAARGFRDGSRAGDQPLPAVEHELFQELLAGKPWLIVPDVHSDPRWQSAGDGGDVRSRLSVALRVRDKVIGALNLDHHRAGFYTERHASQVDAMAAQAAIAIENARLHEEEHYRLAEAERRNRELSALHGVAAAISSSLDLNTVLGEALAQALKVADLETGGVYLLDEAGTWLTLRVQHNLEREFVARGGRLRVDQGLSAQVARTGQPFVVEDLSAQLDLLQPALVGREWLLEVGYRSGVLVPLLAHGRLMGIFFGMSRRLHRFGPADLRLLAAIGEEMGVAVENARLHQVLQDYAAELELRVEARTAELSRERERLLAILESAGEGIAITNADGVIEYANPAWEKLTGHQVAQAIEQKLRIVDEETFPDLFLFRQGATQYHHVWRQELVGKRPDGTEYTVNLTVTPIFTDMGDTRELSSLVAVYRDVTEYKELDRMKSEFLSTAAHELRGPLTSIMGFSELLLTRPQLTDDERKRFLEHINKHAGHLKELIDDLLDISRIESGASFAVELAPIELREPLEQEVRAWQEAEPTHNYVLRAAEPWPRVQADAGRLRQVMRNLLSNAAKYSPAGSEVTISVMPVGKYVEISVADQGVGMTAEELSHLFEKFWRADASSTAAEGTGLGLVIVKYIVEHHGGQIWVESQPGKGTTVHFTLLQVGHRTTVLVVEDEASVREIEQRILISGGLATIAASDGQEALKLALAHRPDLILLDLMMPGMSGMDVLYALKNNPATAMIPVVVLSARSGWQVIEETHMLGAVDFLAKPFEYEELLGRVRRALVTAAHPSHRKRLPFSPRVAEQEALRQTASEESTSL